MNATLFLFEEVEDLKSRLRLQKNKLGNETAEEGRNHQKLLQKIHKVFGVRKG